MNGNDNSRAGSRSRRLLPYAGAVLLAALLVAGLWPDAVPVEVASVTVGSLRATVSEEGKTRVQDRYTVCAPVTGNLRRIPFKAGAPVKAGETVVAVLEPLSAGLLDPRARAQAEARRDSALAALEKARLSAEHADSEYKRFERLFSDGTISPQEREVYRVRNQTAARDLVVAESALRQAEAELAVFGKPADSGGVIEVKAPANGRVLRVIEENARTITVGTPILVIGDPTDLEVVIEVLSRDGASIEPGTRVELDHWGGGPPLEATVRLVEPGGFTKVSALGVEEQRVNVIADVLTPIEKRHSLGDNFRVEARIIVWEDPKALKVPAGALFRLGQDWACLALEAGRAKLRRVNVGRSSGLETQILEGLKEGQEVILYPGSRVRDGQRVKKLQISNGSK
jgi:HlyD family secretion protein